MPATDVVELIRSLLATNWLPANTDTVTPTVVDSGIDGKRYQLKEKKDIIFVYRGGLSRKDKVGHSGDFATEEEPVTVDIRTNHAPAGGTIRTHLTKVVEEAERILEANRKNPDAYWEWAWANGFDYPSEYPDFMRSTGEVLLRKIWRGL